VNPFHTEVSDAELVGDLIKNRPEAHRLVVDRFGPLVRGLLRRSLGPANDIDDVEQEVFWCLFRRIATLRDPLSLRPFIMAITFRIVLRERRRRRKLARLTLEPELAQIGPTTKCDEAVGSHALMRLGKLLHRLHERERRTFILRFVEGMTVSEIADALALSEATTRRSFKRARLLVSKWAGRDPFLSDYFGVGYSVPAAD
jgi:RNA polymerase sigma-70 factor (ECF subfamily)